MRLWHKDLICVLPQKQLVSQWRECCCIAKNIADNGTPNHLLVNKILEYNPSHFVCYVNKVLQEMEFRGYKVSKDSYVKMVSNLNRGLNCFSIGYVAVCDSDIFKEWHNDRYLIQCYYNLQEKYDCGGISNIEWSKIEDFVTK